MNDLNWHIALFCGSRTWGKPGPILRKLQALKRKHGNKLIIIQGGAPGADLLSCYWAHELDIHVAQVDALWNTRHKAAGPQRNTAMLALRPAEVCAYHPDLPKSSGTKDCIKQALKLEIPVNLNNRKLAKL